jgi:catechol 2,3-dioxygenase-like lactoylglutathione lyase family enzyme
MESNGECMSEVHEVTLIVENIERSKEFYEDVLGFRQIENPGSRVELDAGRCSIVLEGDFEEEVFAQYNLRKPTGKRGDGLVLELNVDDVEEIYENAVEKGVEILTEPKIMWGRNHFLLEDPDGYVLGIGKSV